MTYSNKTLSIIRWSITLLLAGTFMLSSIHKIIHPDEFALAVYRYHLLPYSLVNIASLWISWTELIVAISLFIPRLRVAGYLLVMLMLTVFSLSIGIMIVQGNEMSCGCFSSSPLDPPLGIWSIIRNLVLILGGLGVGPIF